jgi:immunoglobulin-binding protein 1
MHIKHAIQVAISAALVDFRALVSRINTLGLFSPNESFDEISIRNAVYMLVPYCVGDIQLRARTLEPEDRVEVITKAMVSDTVISHSCHSSVY